MIIYSQPGNHLGCTYHFPFVAAKEMVNLPPNILWLSLSGNHIHWHSHEKKRKYPSLLVVKERGRSTRLRDTQRHPSPGFAPRYRLRLQMCFVLTPFLTGPTTFIVLLLIRTKNLDLFVVVSSISPDRRGVGERGWGGGG